MNLETEIKFSLNKLQEAVLQILSFKAKNLAPHLRGKTFHIAANIFFSLDKMRVGDFQTVFIGESKLIKHSSYIAETCKYQPRKVLQAIKHIETMEEWCYKRLEGMKRASEEILRQQTEDKCRK